MDDKVFELSHVWMSFILFSREMYPGSSMDSARVVEGPH